MKHPVILSVIAPGATWGVWLAAAHEWLIKWNADIQALSFLAALMISLMTGVAWTYKFALWLRRWWHRHYGS